MDKMKIKDLIKELKKFNPEADVTVVVHNYPEDFSITWGNAEGCTKENCDEVSFYVDRLCDNETSN